MSTRTQGYKRSAPDGAAAGGSYHKSKQAKFGSNSGSGSGKPYGQKHGGGANSSGFKGKSGGGGQGGFNSNKGKGPAGGYNKGKGPAKHDDELAAAGKRKRPITQGGGEEDVNSDDDDEVEGDDEGMEVDASEGDGGAVGGEQQEKRPRMTKAEKAALHAAQPHRTTLLPSYSLLQELLPLWEPARRADIPKEERKQAVKALWNAVKGRVAEISKGHKGTRILQTVVKHGGKEERLGVAMELRPQWRQMMESKYAKFLMRKLIRYCPSIRPLLIEDLTPVLPHLLTHADAVQPLSDFYDLYASAKERRALVRGLYPKEVRLTSSSATADDDAQGLDSVLEGMPNEQGRLRVLEGVEKTVLNVFNATQKAALSQAIYHRLVREYLDCIYRFLDAETADAKMHELLTASLESLADIVHTKDGASVARELIVRGGAKDRKQILQHLRKHIPLMAKDADAQLVLFTAYDCVDDTKLMGKTFVADVVASANELVFDKIGRRTVLYLLVPDSTVHFIAPTLATLSESAQKAREIGTSKKDPAIRRKELLGYASAGLLAAVQEKAEQMVRDPGAGLVVQEIMLRTEGDKTAAVAALAKPLETPYPEEPASNESESDAEAQHVLDLSHATRTYKTVLSGGKFKMKTQTMEVLDEKLPALAASAFWDAIVSEDAGGASNAVRVAQGHASLVVVEMIAGLKKAGREAEVKKVLGKKEVIAAVEAAGRKGSAVLLETLKAL